MKKPLDIVIHDLPIKRVLELARWAPSGQNIQPWRFEIVDDRTLLIHVYNTARMDFYRSSYPIGDIDMLDTGFLLENLRIAATTEQLQCSWEYQGGSDTVHQIKVIFRHQSELGVDPLHHHISVRTTDRRPYRTDKLSDDCKNKLSSLLGNALEIHWLDDFKDRLQQARLNSTSMAIRMSIPETMTTHIRALDWQNRFSKGLLVQATMPRTPPLPNRVLRWLLQDWSRTQFANRIGVLVPVRMMFDFFPGLFCGAHFFISYRSKPSDENLFLLHTGQAIQRFWLTATSMGLVMQPILTTLTLPYYVKRNIYFSRNKSAMGKARKLTEQLGDFWQKDIDTVLFVGRIGYPRHTAINARSLRYSLRELLVK